MIRLKPLLVGSIGIAAIAAAIRLRPDWRIIYNPSESAPRGWYLVKPADSLGLGHYVVAWPPAGAANLAAERGYLPSSVPILKQVFAVAGQEVCTRDGTTVVADTLTVRALDVDGAGRSLLPWQGCRTLQAGEIFLLNPGNPSSFDSRYFGPIDIRAVIGRAIPLCTWSAS